MGETELIERIATRFIGLPTPEAIAVVQGIGDDCAVVQVGKQMLVLTVDMLVEGVHFRLDWTDPHALGWKALAVNLSDIAAMGGVPALALLSVALPAQRGGAWLDALIAGIAECARTYGCTLVGGDTNRSEQVILDIAVVGTVDGTPVMRSGAQPGDWLMVTGSLGGSR
ncbi:MAG: thiamine-phosphate kinase, partial [Armatimonadota bacterium]